MKSIIYLLFPVFLLGQTADSTQGVYDEAKEEAFEYKYRPGDHELLLMPTAYTMEKGSLYFSDYELFFLNLNMAVTSRTHIGLFTLFPITNSFIESLTFGFKQNYLRQEYINSSLWATYTLESSGLTFGNVLSMRSNTKSLHLGIGGMKNLDSADDDIEFIYMLGCNLDVSRKFSLIGEYTNFSTLLENYFNGLISVGFRFRGESIAWDIGGTRPLEETGEFLFFPLLKATILLR